MTCQRAQRGGADACAAAGDALQEALHGAAAAPALPELYHGLRWGAQWEGPSADWVGGMSAAKQYAHHLTGPAL